MSVEDPFPNRILRVKAELQWALRCQSEVYNEMRWASPLWPPMLPIVVQLRDPGRMPAGWWR